MKKKLTSNWIRKLKTCPRCGHDKLGKYKMGRTYNGFVCGQCQFDHGDYKEFLARVNGE